tara:strand:- start:175 stop:582 length:408 start_codon:yes stop_codon:yes gene_type:complete
MAKSAAQRFKEQRAKMKAINEGRTIDPDAPVNKLTSKEFEQQSRNRDDLYKRRMRGIGRIALSGHPFKATTAGTALTIGNIVGKGARNVKRVFAPSDKKIIQDRLKKNYENLQKSLNKRTSKQIAKNIKSGRIFK